MTTNIQIGRRLVPLEHIALIEPFDSSSQPELRSERPFKSRVVFINRDSALIEEPLANFAAQHGLRLLEQDGIATNPAIAFTVEAFTPTESFAPDKPYKSRLRWRDNQGNARSKLLLTAPEAVVSLAIRNDGKAPRGVKAPKVARRSRQRGETPAPR